MPTLVLECSQDAIAPLTTRSRGLKGEESSRAGAAFTALLEGSAEELYESLCWTGWGLRWEQVAERRRFADLLTIGGKVYHVDRRTRL